MAMKSQTEYLIDALCSLRDTTPIAYGRGQVHAFRLAIFFATGKQLDSRLSLILNRVEQADDSAFYEMASDIAADLMAE